MPRSIGFTTGFEFDHHGGQTWDRVTIKKFANGHREASITRYKTLSEPPTGYDPLTNTWAGPSCETPPSRGSGDRDSSIERASRRARSAARERCKASGFDSLFTFTYRANVQDRDLVARHWKETVRRIRRLIPDFAYLAVLEHQARGSLHLHVATHRLPMRLADPKLEGVKLKSWDVLRRIWRDVVGDLGGNFDESKRRARSRANGLRIARYITKYLAKDFAEGDLNRKRYWAGGDWPAPERVTMLFAREGSHMSSTLLAMVFEDVVGQTSDYTIWHDGEREIFWVAAFDPPNKGG